MKPNFALRFSDTTITLLHRTAKGWAPLGETPFDAPDLEDALDYLRKAALGLEPGGFSTKLVIPNSQILYTEVAAPGPTEDERRAQIAAALGERTPYQPDEIAYDFTGRGKTVKVAAVARETLAEAESFAVAHRFNPVSFVAMPEEAFNGEPWFGTTAAAAGIVAPGETVERDKSAMTVLAMSAKARAAAAERAVKPATVVAPPAPVSDTAASSIVAKTGGTGHTSERPLPADLFAAAPEAASVKAAEVDEAPFTHVADPELLNDAVKSPAAVPPEPAPALAQLNGTAGLADDDLPPAPSAAVMATLAARRADAVEQIKVDRPAIPVARLPETRPDAAALARAARGKPIEDLPPMPRPPMAPKPTAKAPAMSAATAIERKGKQKPAIAPRSPAPVSASATVPAAGEAARSLERSPFSRQPKPGRPRHLGLILTALLLLALALVAAWSSFNLSSDQTGNEATGALASPETTADNGALPAVEDEMLADAQDPGDLMAEPESAPQTVQSIPEAMVAATADDPPPAESLAATEPAAEPATAPAALPVPADLAEAAPDPVPAPEPAPEVAAETAPDTALTSDSPDAVALVDPQDEIFLAASDAPPPAFDALALPVPETAADAPPGTAMPPTPYGLVYRFDANGQIVPTPEGIPSPDGYLLILGKPDRVPPARSPAAVAAAAAALAPPVTPALPETGNPSLVAIDPLPAAATEPAAQPNPDLADRRPRPRPEGLAPASAEDDAAVQVADSTRFASLRPRSRPASVLAAIERARAETAAASLAAAPAVVEPAAISAADAANPSMLAISRRPAERPDNFSRAVEAAVAAAVRAPEPEPEPVAQLAAAAPEIKPEEQDEINEPDVASNAPAPKIPTKVTVAKQATFKNALNLNKVNLIGVYGTPSKRHALIRLASGRYKKVTVGDSVDGGRVQAITQTEVRYQKSGRLISLKMPES